MPKFKGTQPTLSEVLNSSEFISASKQEQDNYLNENGLTREALQAQGITIKQPGVFATLARDTGRGVAEAARIVSGTALRGNVFDDEAESLIDPLAAKVYNYAQDYLTNNPSFATKDRSRVLGWFSDAAESIPASNTISAPTIIGTVIGGVPGALAGGAVSAGLMYGGTELTWYMDTKEELERRGIPYDDRLLRAQARKATMSETGTEVIGDWVTGIALKVLPGGTTSKVGIDLLKDLFEPSGKTLIKQLGKAYGKSQIGEQASELTNLAIQENLREPLGLDNRFGEQWLDTMATTFIQGGVTTGVGAAVTAPSRKKQIDTLKDTLFSGIEDASKLSPEQQEVYIQKRLKTASDLVPVIEQNLGEDAAKNFMINVVEATKTAVDTSIPNPGALPFNNSIFSGKLDFSQTVAPNQTQDIDPFNTQENPFAKRKAAEDMIKGARQEADAAVVSPAKGDVNALEEWTQGELFNQMPVSKPVEFQDIGPAQQMPVVPEVGQQTLPLSYSNPVNQQYSNLANLQTQPQTMPVGTDSVSVPSTREAFVATPPVAVSDPNAKVVGGQTPVTTPQESRELVYDNVKTLDLKLRNPKYLQSLSDGALVQLRTTDMTNVLSPKAVQNVAKEFDRRNALQEQQVITDQQYAQQPSGSQLNLFEPTSVPNSTLENQNELVDDSGASKKPFKLRKGANNVVPKGGQLVLEPQAETVAATPVQEAPIETPAVEVPKKILKKKAVKDKPKSTSRVEVESNPISALKKVATEVTDAPTLQEVKRVEKAIEAKKAEVNRIDVALRNKMLSTKKREALETQKKNVLTDIDNLELDLEDAQKTQEIINKKISKEAKAKKESAVSEEKTPNKELESLIEDKARVKYILEHIAETSENKLVAKIAKALVSLNPKVEIKLVEGLKDANNDTVMGLYNGVDTITLNKDFFGKADMSGVFVHELVHHLVSDKLNRKAYSIFRTRLETLKDQVRTALEKKGMNPEDFYGLQITSDIDEFLAEAMSDLSLQKVLESVKIDTKDSKVKTLFDKFVSIIKDVLGLDPSNHTVLKEVLSIGLELTTQERIYGKALVDHSKPLLKDASAAKAKKQDKSEQALKDAQQRDSIRLVHRMIGGVMDLKDLAVDNFVIPFVRAESGNPVFKKMLELYETRQKNYSNFVFNATLDENGVPVFENAWESYRDLNEEQRNAWKHLLFVGDGAVTEYNNIEEANKAIKEVAEGRTRYEGTVDKKTFAAYQQARLALNNAFKSQSAQLFSYVINNTFGKYGNDVVKAATKAIVKTGGKNTKLDRDNRVAYFKDQLRALELSEKDIDKYTPLFRNIMTQGRKLVKYTLGGGLPGYVPRLRPSRKDNPFVFTLYKTITNKKGDVSRVKVYSKPFSTQGELDAFTKMVNAPSFDIKTIIPFKEIGDINQYKDHEGNLLITAERDTSAEAADLFRISPQDRKLTEALIHNVLGQLKEDTVLTTEQQEKIEQQIYNEYTKKMIANTIPRYLSRSKNYIAGYDVINPLEAMMESLSSTGSYVATNDYINNMMQAINKAKGVDKINLTKEFKNSLTKVNDTIRTFNNVVSSTYLMFKVVTAASQLHQYVVFGMTDLVAQGVPPTKAATLLMTAYARILMHRLSINGPALRKALQGDNPIGRQFRKVPMHGIVLRAMKEAERKASQKIGSIPSKEERVVFTPDELAMLDEHRINNDTYEGITKEYNTIENSIKDNFSSTLNAYVVKPGMILFNQMEIINREATLLAMYDFQREVKGQSHEVANKAATRFMHRVNGDFSKINKIGLLRKYPNFSMMFQLTSFFFHTIGMMGLYSKDAAKSIAKGKVTDPSVQAMFVMMGMFMALGGAKGSPFADFFNKLFSILFGEDFLLSIEKDINKMVVDKTDPASVERYMAKKVADMFMRGAPAAIGIDWSANVALRPPFIDAFIDQAYSDKAPSGLVAGAGPNWITAVGKAAGYAINGEFWRALATAPMGGLSDLGRSVLYSKEGYGSAKGGVSYIGTKQRKLEGTDMLVKAAGFKTTEMAQTQDIINSEYTVIKGYWERNRANAITEFTKALSPYILNNKQVPKEVVNEALESIQEFNKKWMKADKDIRSVVKPIDSSTIQSSIKSRMFPKKKSLTYQIQQTDIIDKE